MFIYEKAGKLCIMVTGGLPAAEGETPNIVIEPVAGDPVTAKVTINGNEVATGTYTLPTASADTLGGVKVGEGLTIADGVLSVG